MAKFLVTGPPGSLAHRVVLARIREAIQEEGHAAKEADPSDARSQLRDADALVALLDQPTPEVVGLVTSMQAMQKPVLGLRTRGEDRLPAFLEKELTMVEEASDEEGWHRALGHFYRKVRPFAGKLVRDKIPKLVEEAGHSLKFRELEPSERPHILKQKVAEEAESLRQSDLADEREEIADVLESLEAFIRARGYDRDDLRRVKQRKIEQRGSFERCYVVEATSAAAEEEAAPSEEEEEPAWIPVPEEKQKPAPSSSLFELAQRAKQAGGDEPAAPEPPQSGPAAPQEEPATEPARAKEPPPEEDGTARPKDKDGAQPSQLHEA